MPSPSRREGQAEAATWQDQAQPRLLHQSKAEGKPTKLAQAEEEKRRAAEGAEGMRPRHASALVRQNILFFN